MFEEFAGVGPLEKYVIAKNKRMSHLYREIP